MVHGAVGRRDRLAVGPADRTPWPDRVFARRVLSILVFATAAMAFFFSYRLLNDNFDRLARARQIVAFGEVPFRDFFDPGYFLTLYASALVQRILGHNLLGELLLNVLSMAAGTTLVFVMAWRASRSLLWGLASAALVIVAQPRAYDYDKVLFYPLGLWACWRYCDRPTTRTAAIASATAALAGLFRYDSGLYIGVAAVAAILARQWGRWPEATRHLASAALATAVSILPALIFIQWTAGLGDAYAQIRNYAAVEAAHGQLFHPPAFAIQWAAPLWTERAWFPGYASGQNAGAWLFYMATGLPAAALLIESLRRGPRDRATLARVICFVTLAECVALFILRNPILARVGGVMPLVAVASSYLVGEWLTWLRQAGREGTAAGFLRRTAVGGAGVALCLVTFCSVAAVEDAPSKASYEVTRRLSEFAETPPSLNLWPSPPWLPLVKYLRACTRPQDRIFAAWFFSESYYFTGRGFAAGLPVLFGDHWSELTYQRRSLQLLEQQSVPIIVATQSDDITHYGFLWAYIDRNYDLVHTEGPGYLSLARIWARRGLPITRRYEEGNLPCYAD